MHFGSVCSCQEKKGQSKKTKTRDDKIAFELIDFISQKHTYNTFTHACAREHTAEQIGR